MDDASPKRRLMWLWAAFRALWITAFPLLCAAGMLLVAALRGEILSTVFIDCTHTDYRGVSWSSY